jgi:hypothetical protein
MPMAGLEPANPKVEDFKSAAYTISPHRQERRIAILPRAHRDNSLVEEKNGMQ